MEPMGIVRQRREAREGERAGAKESMEKKRKEFVAQGAEVYIPG
jgi:hypothetical protein